jgi:isochorismate synthase EntC
MSFYMADFLRSGAIMSLSKDKLLIGWGEPQRVSARELDFRRPTFYFSDFFLKTAQPWIQYSHWLEISTEKFNRALAPTAQLPTCNWVIDSPEEFRQSFNELQQLLQTDQLQKGVPYLFASSSNLMNEERLQQCLKRALTLLEQQKGYLYGHWHLSSGILGLTPELLFSHSQNQPEKLYTMALAGTCPYSHCQESFLKNEKEQYEHQLVVQGICQSLQTLGEVQIEKIQLLQLPYLMHLMTPIAVKLNHPFCFDALVNCLHPTPALGTFPIQAGKKWLENYQKHTPRHYFGAPIGFRYPPTGLSQCFVAIRNVQWNSAGMRIGAGCGVIKQSIFDKEWQEVHFKLKAIQDQLHL